MALRLRGSLSILGLVYLVIGIIAAWVFDYITAGLLRLILSALLAILLWPLVLLGVGLHLR